MKNPFFARNVKKVFRDTAISTDGIEIWSQVIDVKVESKYQVPISNLQFNLWDFGGQTVYYMTHSLFLSERGVYIVVWNLLKTSKSDIDRIDMWVKTVQALGNDSIILLVGTHFDDTEDLCIDTKFLFRQVSERTGIPQNCILEVSYKDATNIGELITLLIEKSLTLPYVGKPFPKLYMDLKHVFDEESKKRIPPIIFWADLKQIVKKLNLIGAEVERAVRFLHTLGHCLFLSNDPVRKQKTTFEGLF